MEFLVSPRSALSTTEARAFIVGGREIVLCDVDGEVYALDGICTQEDLPLDGGENDDGVLECPWLGADYDGAGNSDSDREGAPSPRTGVDFAPS